jgi:probable F420-dependent oxidoreductase
MDFSVGIPTCKEGLSYPLPFADVEDIVRICQEAERLGYHSVWGNDHIMAPQYVREEYADPPRFFEPLVTLAYVAAHTTRIKLGTAVLVVPMREPAFLAKQVATLDHVSGGRVLLGVGVGAYREELEKLTPRLRGADRGEVFGEGLAALRLLLTERTATFDGKYLEFEGLEVFPKPVQQPFPIYVGGNHPNQIRRAAEHGNGWLTASLPPARVAEGAAKVREAAEAIGRDPAEIIIAPQTAVCLGRTHEAAIEAFMESPFYRHLHTLRDSTMRSEDLTRLVEANLIGTPDEVIERIHAFQDAGASLIAQMAFVSPTVDATLEDIQFFAEEVMPAFAVASAPA